MGSDSENRENGITHAYRHGVSKENADDFEEDLQVAARKDVCVLITAEPDVALEVTQEVALRDGSARGQICVLDCDAMDPQTLGAVLCDRLLAPDPGARHASEILLLREVHALSAENQAVLADLLDTGRSAVRRPRIIASSSTPLFDRVQEGTFDVRLFYRLNTINIAPRKHRRHN
jgi:transcriptional regulator of acetoin/glycerol metabolism